MTQRDAETREVDEKERVRSTPRIRGGFRNLIRRRTSAKFAVNLCFAPRVRRKRSVGDYRRAPIGGRAPVGSARPSPSPSFCKKSLV